MLSFRKKPMSRSQKNIRVDRRTDRRRDREILLYRTLLTEDGGPRTSFLQVTGGNTPNLALKRMLRYFLNTPPLKKILPF